MKSATEIKDKVVEILQRNNIPLPEHELDSGKGISRLMMYYNKYSTEEMKNEIKNFINEVSL